MGEYIVSGKFNIPDFRRIPKENRTSIVINCPDRLSDNHIKALMLASVTIVNYPDVNQVIKFARPKSWISVKCPVEKIDADGAQGPMELIIATSAIVTNMKRLVRLISYEFDIELFIENCPKLRTINLNSVERLSITGKCGIIDLIASSVKRLSVPKTLTYHPRIIPTKLLPQLYAICITIDDEADLDRCETNAFNTNVLRINSIIPMLDMTRFDLSEVTTLIIGKDAQVNFRIDSLPKLISWTSYPLVLFPLPELPKLLFLFILRVTCEGRAKEFAKTKKLIRDHAHLYINGLCRASLIMDIRSDHEDAGNPELDVDSLLTIAENQRAELLFTGENMSTKSARTS